MKAPARARARAVASPADLSALTPLYAAPKRRSPHVAAMQIWTRTWASRTWALIGEWRRRSHSRHQLAMMSERERKDIGYRHDIEAEIAKPFWRP